MKQYKKTYEDLFRDKGEIKLERIGAYDRDIYALIQDFKELYTESYGSLFATALRYLWLEKQITYNGERRVKRWKNGHVPDQIFGRFMAQEVGKDHGLLTRNRWFHVTSYFIAEYFPDFLDKNPFETPEVFEYPYKYATLDFFGFVYQVSNAREMMDYAEDNQMSFHDFRNWASNYVLCYNDEQGKEIYSISKGRDSSFFIKSTKWGSHPLDILYESKQEPKADSGEHDPV